MPAYEEQRSLPYTPEQLFDLVSDIEKYPEFLPWCSAARIISRDGEEIIADLIISFKIWREKFTSRVKLTPPSKNEIGKVEVELVEGPFTHLINRWEFYPEKSGQTLISFFVDFKFKSALLEKMIGMMFEFAVKEMGEAFEKRAHSVYGNS